MSPRHTKPVVQGVGIADMDFKLSRAISLFCYSPGLFCLIAVNLPYHLAYRINHYLWLVKVNVVRRTVDHSPLAVGG